MIAVVWSAPAVEQLKLIRTYRLRRRLFLAVGGLGRFPRTGRLPVEVERFPDLELPAELREIVIGRQIRNFYLYDGPSETVRVLGMLFRGQDVGGDWLRKALDA